MSEPTASGSPEDGRGVSGSPEDGRGVSGSPEDGRGVPGSPEAPSLGRRWTEPAPVIAFGILAFLVAGVVVSLVDSWNGAAATCWTGAVIGALGFALFAAQRRSARRGDKGAQRGLL